MRRSVRAAALALLLLAGCSGEPTGQATAEEDAELRARFAEVQTAVKDRDGDKLWTLLDARSRGEAEKAAQKLKEGYAKATPDDQAKLQETHGLSKEELIGLTPQRYLKSRKLSTKYEDLPGSKVERVAREGENATLYYLEPDGDHEKAIFLREDGKWKIWLRIPG